MRWTPTRMSSPGMSARIFSKDTYDPFLWHTLKPKIAKDLKVFEINEAGLIDVRTFAIKITRIAHGIPMGGDLEYADEITLAKALEGRREF